MTGAAGFPAPIAGAMQAWDAETDLFRRQARLIACFEAFIQYAAILAVSEFHRAGLDRVFPDIDAVIRDVIHRPSTGTWQRIYREAMGAFRDRRSALVADALYRFGFDDAGRQQPWMRAADLITQLRNEQKGHGHLLEDETEYRAILARHDSLLRELLEQAEFARELTLCVVVERSPRGIAAARLMGPVESAGPRDEYPPADDAPPPGRVAVRHRATGRWIDLSPLLLYLECERDVERIDAHGVRTRERCGRPGVFFHHELLPPSRVRGFEYRYAHHSSWRFPEFEFVGAYLERYSRRAAPRAEAEWYQARISEATRFFVGREEPLRQLTALTRGGPRRTAFVVAPPGFGKSTLLAKWIARVEGESVAQPALHVFRHFIQEQYPETGRASNVFDVLRLQVCARFRLDSTSPWPDGRARADRYRAALIESLGLAVRAGERPAIALVIDGLDEAMRVTAGEDEALLDWLPGPDLLPPGVSLILSGRPVVETVPVFKRRFGRESTQYFPLSRLADAEVREWFVLAFGPVYALEHADFLERVAGVARGHPQYLHFVHRALMDGSLQPGGVETLPAGLEDFYARVMADASGTQPLALRVIALLAASAAPLNLSTIAAVLGTTADAVALACDAARNVLEWDLAGHVLLFDAEFAEWVRAGDVRSSVDALRRDTFAAMATRLLDWCRDWASHRNAYAAANLVNHLLAAERHEEIAALARDAGFLGFQASARPDAPDLPQATFRAALHRASQAGDHVAVAELGLRRVSWATAMLAESPQDAYRNGSLLRARRLADLHEPVERLSWYFLLAHEILLQEGAAASQQFLGLPGRLPWWPAARSALPGDLHQVADVLIRLYPLPLFNDLWRLYLDDSSRSRLAANLVNFDRLDLVEAMLTEIPASPHRDLPLIKLAAKVAETGDFERAYRLADGMWLSESRWTARELVAAAAAPSQGLAILETARREASKDPRARDALVQKIALSFSRAGRLEEAGTAATRIESVIIRDTTLGAIALEALDRSEFASATRLIAMVSPRGALRRSLLDRAGLAALRRLRIDALFRVFRADPVLGRLGIWLGALSILVGSAALVAMTAFDARPVASLWPVAWLVGALAIAVGLREGSWRMAVSALAWGGLTALSLSALSDASPLAIAGAMTAAALALLASALVFGLRRIATVLPRATTVALVAVVVAVVLTATAGQRLVTWSSGSAWLQLALLLPGGAAIGAAAFGTLARPEERLAYLVAAVIPGMVLYLLGNQLAGALPGLMLVGWAMAGISSILRPVLSWLGIPGRPALFLATAEAWRAIMGMSSVQKDEDSAALFISLVIVMIMVAVMRRQETSEQATAESPAPVAARRGRRTLYDLTRSPGERKARFNAELLLRLARLFPPGNSAGARDTARAAATEAAGLSAKPDEVGEIEEPVRRDLLWQVAKESWRRRDVVGAGRAACLVEWRRWTGMIACACAVATGLVLGAYARWVIPAELSETPQSLAWTAIGVGSVIAALAITPRLRSLRETLVAMPLTILAAAWTMWGPAGYVRVVPLLLAILLLGAIGAPGSGSVGGWAATLALAWRWQVLWSVPGAMFFTGLAALARGAAWAHARDLFLRPTGALLVFGFLSFIFDAFLRRASRGVLEKSAKDLPRLVSPESAGVSVFERGTFSDDVGAAVVRLAEREPAALEGIARAAARVA